MDPITSIDFFRIFIGEQPDIYWLEIMFRVLIIYVIALLFLRAGGKRSRKQLTPMTMLLVVALGSIIGDTMFTPALAILYVLLIMFVVTILQYFFAKLAIRWEAFGTFINSAPHMIMENGEILDESLKAEAITREELFSELRLNGIRNTGEVEYAFLELSGAISVFPYDDKRNVTRGEDILPDKEMSHMKV